jgi:hypothetical protein
MGIVAKDTGKDIVYDPIPQGLHNAICYAVYDLGTQYSEKFNTEQRKILICWELPDVRGDFEKDGEVKNLPKAISAEYTLSLSEKSNLRHDLETWRSRSFTPEELEGFDITKLLGVPCQIQVIHKKSKDGVKTYSNVGGIVRAIQGYDKKPENKCIYFSFEDHGENIPDGIPEWIVNKIHQSKEWKDLQAPPDNVTPLNQESDDETPF